jgi:glycerophosphoryl diester phosphodiesterase
MPPRVIAHRGASRQHPENTIAAFEGARALGADWVELDVRRTAAGELAVHHDKVLADGRAVATLAVGERPPEVPDLAAALTACAGMGVNVEVKPHDDLGVVEPVVDIVRAWGGPVLVSSFQAELVERFRAVAPDIATGLLVYADPWSVLEAAAAAGHAALHPWDPSVDAELVGACHGLGLQVNVWTVDDPDRMRELAAWGVDGIVTNAVDLAVATLHPPARPPDP